MDKQSELDRFQAEFTAGYSLVEQDLSLQIEGWVLVVRSNSSDLLQRLAHYFRHIVVTEPTPASVCLTAIQRPPPDLPVAFKDWEREAGKSGRKDACFDFAGGRLVHKVRTGMVFLQCVDAPVAAGDCLANDNQVINFINAQFMNWLQQKNWLICHAAAIEMQGKSIAIAAFSGGGKSTTMLRLMDLPNSRFLTNDRLFIRGVSDAAEVQISGVPKLPRINPGTIVANPVLQPILSSARREQLLAMPRQALWDLEEKYDVDILETYGPERIQHVAELGCFLILNWKHHAEKMAVQKVDLKERRDLLPALMKTPGPFYQQSDGQFQTEQVRPEPQRYINTLAGAAVYEVSGGIDFDGLSAWCRQWLA